MTLWTVYFDATVSITLEADSQEEAIRGAEGIIANLEDGEGRLREEVDYSIGEVFLIRNEDTGEETIK